MAPTDHITADALRAALHFEPETGVFTWRGNADRSRSWNTRYASTRAGGEWTVPKTGRRYWRVKIGDRLYLAHRLAWLYVHGEWPGQGLDIDHINGDGLDNRIANLRLATRSQNIANSKAHRDNATGFKGVSFNREKQKFEAYIYHDGRQRSLGYHDTAEEAHAAYCHAAREVFGEFARSS